MYYKMLFQNNLVNSLLYNKKMSSLDMILLQVLIIDLIVSVPHFARKEVSCSTQVAKIVNIFCCNNVLQHLSNVLEVLSPRLRLLKGHIIIPEFYSWREIGGFWIN